ncbi:TPA: hypothetical protein QCJ60_004254 [Enterobacter sichuanensis]|nr:hypothetical protein [Enterobacter sichuanensis]
MSYANRYACDLSGQITRIRCTPTAEDVALGIESDEIAYRHGAAGRLLKHYEPARGTVERSSATTQRITSPPVTIRYRSRITVCSTGRRCL